MLQLVQVLALLSFYGENESEILGAAPHPDHLQVECLVVQRRQSSYALGYHRDEPLLVALVYHLAP